MTRRPPAVLKVGGSILRDADGYRRTAERVAAIQQGGSSPWIVVSAARGVTDALLALRPEPGSEPVVDMADRHLELVGAPEAGHLAGWLRRTLARACRAGLPARVAWGEQASAAVLRAHLARLGVNLPVVELGPASFLGSATGAVVPGFYLRLGPDRVACLARGAGDLSAVLVAAGLGARVVRLWKEGGGLRIGGRVVEEIGAIALLASLADPVRPVQAAALGLAALHGVDLVLEDPWCGGPATRIVAPGAFVAGPARGSRPEDWLAGIPEALAPGPGA